MEEFLAKLLMFVFTREQNLHVCFWPKAQIFQNNRPYCIMLSLQLASHMQLGPRWSQSTHSVNDKTFLQGDKVQFTDHIQFTLQCYRKEKYQLV